jgi:hypothetical protein
MDRWTDGKKDRQTERKHNIRACLKERDRENEQQRKMKRHREREREIDNKLSDRVRRFDFSSFGLRDIHSGNLCRPSSPPGWRQRGCRWRSGVNVIKHFSFVTDDEAQEARVFFLGNSFQSGLRV